MTGDGRPARACAVAGTAAAGVLTAHWLDYLLVVPQEAARGAVLDQTGHGWLPGAVEPVVVATVVAGLVALAAGFASGRRGRGDGSVVSTALRVSAMQMLLFAAIELAERGIAGAPHDGQFGSLFLFGLALQPLVAAAGALLLHALGRAGERTALAPAAPSASPLRRSAAAAIPPGPRPRLRHVAGAGGIRAPPCPHSRCA